MLQPGLFGCTNHYMLSSYRSRLDPSFFSSIPVMYREILLFPGKILQVEPALNCLLLVLLG